ncbi:MAG: hypothetical protein LUP99_02530 [Methanomicrobiales archaeon]|nr:hypothetical protein [Methanomicrobiales archaeon]
MESDSRSPGSHFLKSLDDYLMQERRTITGDNLFRLYSDCISEITRCKGNSHGFHGLSEFLIFRYIFHTFGGNFTAKKISRDTYEFLSETDSSLRIGQGIPIHSFHKRHHPDIVISDASGVRSVIQIKNQIAEGINELRQEVSTFETLRQKYPEMHSMLVIFHGNINPAEISYLEKIQKDTTWFTYAILEGNQRNFEEIVDFAVKTKDKTFSTA